MSRHGDTPAAARGWWAIPAVLVVAWLVLGGVAGPYAGKLAEVQENDSVAFLPSSAESTQVFHLQELFQEQPVTPAIVVYQEPAGISAKTRRAAAEDTKALAALTEMVVPPRGPVPSEDGKALEVILPLDGTLQDRLPDVVQAVRAQVHNGLPQGVQAHVTGPAGFTADLVGAFAGIDGILLLVAVAVVLVILIVVYRSPILPLVVLLSALFALAAASGAVYALADGGTITLNGQSQGILFILVVGAATDYALLLTARYREELRDHESKVTAMLVAWRRSFAPITASAITVILGLLCLLASELNSTSGLGPVAAFGILASLVASLTFLPAVLVLLGRTAFWPAPPRYGSQHPERAGIWGRVARLVGRRPRWVWVGATLPLVILAAVFAPMFQASGTTQSALFLDPVDSVHGEQVLARHFPAGTASPAIIIGPADARKQLVSTAEEVSGITSVTVVSQHGKPTVVQGKVQVRATLRPPPGGQRAADVVRDLRAEVHQAVPDAKVGGTTAIQVDTEAAAEHDRNTIIPLILAAVLVLLALLLRAIVLPVLLVASVGLNYAATLGVSALVFNHLLGFPGADPAVPLFGFVFLVALGVDYNIFLLTRAREETLRSGTRPGVRRALVATGGVITSAGVVLAATFSALSVIPLLFLAQIAFIVPFGVLLDTLVVRSLLIPALTHDIGRVVWWPSRIARRPQS